MRRLILGAVLFLLFFAAAGFGTHFIFFDKPGMFVWSLEPGKGIVKTKIKKVGPTLLKPASDSPEKAQIKDDSGENDDATVTETTTEDTIPEVVLPPKPKDPNVIELFNGKDLGKWEVTQFGGEGEVFITETNELVLDMGAIMTGVHWSEEPPSTSNYEISLEAMKLAGNDFFCALTFPVKDSHASYIVGGWGGGLVGLSSVDDLDASENETMTIGGFDPEVWYKIRVRVTDEKIEAWIDDEQNVDLDLKDRKISLRPGDIELSMPLGIATFITRAKYRNIVWTHLPNEKNQLNEK